MDNRVTIRAHGSQVLDWVNLISLADCGEFNEMVHMNNGFCLITVDISERHGTDAASRAIVINALHAGSTITFKGVYLDPLNSPLIMNLGGRNFITHQPGSVFNYEVTAMICFDIKLSRPMGHTELVIVKSKIPPYGTAFRGRKRLINYEFSEHLVRDYVMISRVPGTSSVDDQIRPLTT
jgi:hypothetical protein